MIAFLANNYLLHPPKKKRELCVRIRMRINPNVRVHTFKKAMAFASTTSKAEQVMKVVVACPQNMPTIYNVFPSFNVMGFVLLQHKKGENFPCGARQINPQKDMKAKLLHFNKIGCMAHMYFPANLLNYHHSISFLSISTIHCYISSAFNLILNIEQE